MSQNQPNIPGQQSNNMVNSAQPSFPGNQQGWTQQQDQAGQKFQQPFGQQPPNQPYQPGWGPGTQQYPPMPGVDPYSSAKNKGIAALVLGILALLSIFSGVGIVVGIILGIIGVVLGKQAKNELPRELAGMATAGWICSIVALGIIGAFIAIALLFLGGLAALASH